MRIGELAAQAGISTKAIRYYEQIGVRNWRTLTKLLEIAQG